MFCGTLEVSFVERLYFQRDRYRRLYGFSAPTHSLTFSYFGFAIDRKSGFLQSTIVSLFVGVVIVVIAIYTRQRTIGLLPSIKAAQD